MAGRREERIKTAFGDGEFLCLRQKKMNPLAVKEFQVLEA